MEPLLKLVYLKQATAPAMTLAQAHDAVRADLAALADLHAAAEAPARAAGAVSAKASVIAQLNRERADALRNGKSALVARIDADLAALG